MREPVDLTWNEPLPRQMSQLLASIGDVHEMRCVLRDLLTEKEILEISARLEAARLLTTGAKYDEIQAATELSTRTIARVSDWLTNGSGGYASAIKRLTALRNP